MRVKEIFTVILMSVSVVFSSPMSASQPHIYWYTEDYPPFNYMHDGKLEGISIEVLKAIYKQLNWQLDEFDILLMPWARLYRTLEEKDDACAFSMTYTEDRSAKFQFVGPMVENTVSIIGHKDGSYSQTHLKSRTDIQIGVVRNDIGHQLLVKEGFNDSQFVYLKTGLELVRMLKMRRVDFIAYGEIIAQFQFARAQIDPKDYKIVQPLLKSHLGLACNEKVPQSAIMQMNAALAQVIKQNPKLVQWESYFGN